MNIIRASKKARKSKILEKLRSYIGTEMQVKVIDTDRENEKLIVSEKAAYSAEEKKAISELKVGDVIEGEVSGVVDFGAFVKFLPPSKGDSTREEDKLEGLGAYFGTRLAAHRQSARHHQNRRQSESQNHRH